MRCADPVSVCNKFGFVHNNAMNYWLVKSEPGTYSWDDLVKDGWTYWDGVRNYQARNNFKEMKKGDQVL